MGTGYGEWSVGKCEYIDGYEETYWPKPWVSGRSRVDRHDHSVS